MFNERAHGSFTMLNAQGQDLRGFVSRLLSKVTDKGLCSL